MYLHQLNLKKKILLWNHFGFNFKEWQRFLLELSFLELLFLNHSLDKLIFKMTISYKFYQKFFFYEKD